MKTLPFTKMVGAGNDFIIIENVRSNLKKLTKEMCARTTGIGADGVIVLDKSKKADFKMRIINADGSEAEMCGNGARCIASYIVRNKKPKKKVFSIETLAGMILAKAKGEVVKVRLIAPKDYKPEVSLRILGRKITASYIDTGVPHTIIFVDGLKKIDVQTIGREIRFHKKFAPRGTNVNFVEQIKDNYVEARTYERGVEGETLACGTGSVAVAIVSYLRSHPSVGKKMHPRVKVLTKSSEILEVSFDLENRKVSNVWLKGSAKFISKGEYYV